MLFISDNNMAEYDEILTDPYNPIQILDNLIIFPKWLTDKIYNKSDFPTILNETVEDQIIKLHASFYNAIIWYPWVKEWSPDSIFMELTDEEVQKIINDQEFPLDKKELVIKYLDSGYNFVKSAMKSSHKFKKVISFDDFIEEITHPNVIMSFKNGCRHLFFRKWIGGIQFEYRIYVYQNKLRYIEEYLNFNEILNKESAEVRKSEIINFIEKVMPNIQYQDYVIDICLDKSGTFLIIEINTPFYLFGGLHLCKYYYYRDKIHNYEKPVFRYIDIDNNIQEI